ncbi:hypothetical protein GEMRC1_002956 [Eukaryota sp. GEM-RC1]
MHDLAHIRSSSKKRITAEELAPLLLDLPRHTEIQRRCDIAELLRITQRLAERSAPSDISLFRPLVDHLLFQSHPNSPFSLCSSKLLHQLSLCIPETNSSIGKPSILSSLDSLFPDLFHSPTVIDLFLHSSSTNRVFLSSLLPFIEHSNDSIDLLFSFLSSSDPFIVDGSLTILMDCFRDSLYMNELLLSYYPSCSTSPLEGLIDCLKRLSSPLAEDLELISKDTIQSFPALISLSLSSIPTSDVPSAITTISSLISSFISRCLCQVDAYFFNVSSLPSLPALPSLLPQTTWRAAVKLVQCSTDAILRFLNSNLTADSFGFLYSYIEAVFDIGTLTVHPSFNDALVSSLDSILTVVSSKEVKGFLFDLVRNHVSSCSSPLKKRTGSFARLIVIGLNYLDTTEISEIIEVVISVLKIFVSEEQLLTDVLLDNVSKVFLILCSLLSNHLFSSKYSIIQNFELFQLIESAIFKVEQTTLPTKYVLFNAFFHLTSKLRTRLISSVRPGLKTSINLTKILQNYSCFRIVMLFLSSSSLQCVFAGLSLLCDMKFNPLFVPKADSDISNNLNFIIGITRSFLSHPNGYLRFASAGVLFSAAGENLNILDSVIKQDRFENLNYVHGILCYLTHFSAEFFKNPANKYVEDYVKRLDDANLSLLLSEICKEVFQKFKITEFSTSKESSEHVRPSLHYNSDSFCQSFSRDGLSSFKNLLDNSTNQDSSFYSYLDFICSNPSVIEIASVDTVLTQVINLLTFQILEDAGDPVALDYSNLLLKLSSTGIFSKNSLSCSNSFWTLLLTLMSCQFPGPFVVKEILKDHAVLSTFDLVKLMVEINCSMFVQSFMKFLNNSETVCLNDILLLKSVVDLDNPTVLELLRKDHHPFTKLMGSKVRMSLLEQLWNDLQLNNV